jgi:hypothetical protein
MIPCDRRGPHPAATSVRAVASPIPEVAPTTHATLSFNTGVPLIVRTDAGRRLLFE